MNCYFISVHSRGIQICIESEARVQRGKKDFPEDLVCNMVEVSVRL